MRTHYCGQLNAEHIGQTVELCGWVHRRRDHGGVIFVDLRDHKGLVQVVFDPDTEATFAMAERVRNEFVLQVKGRVRSRPEGTVNPDMPTGKIEVLGVDDRHIYLRYHRARNVADESRIMVARRDDHANWFDDLELL